MHLAHGMESEHVNKIMVFDFAVAAKFPMRNTDLEFHAQHPVTEAQHMNGKSRES